MNLQRLYLCVHALSWIEIAPADQRRRELLWGGGEHWPGRTAACHELDLVLRQKMQRLIREIEGNDDQAFLILPTGLQGNRELIEFARAHLGPRCLVCRLGADLAENRRTLGAEFSRGLAADRAAATAAHGAPASAYELAAWERSRAWAADFDQQLATRGYRYDPATVECVTFGANWVGCGATYPIQMARAFGLARAMQRRFELSNPDWSPLLLAAEPIQQNLSLAGQVLLYIFRNGHLGPMAATPSPDVRGRYLAQYWEGIRGIMDPAHVVTVDFPAGSVREVDLFGVEVARARGLWAEPNRGPVTMSVGSGVFTPYHSTLVMAEEHLSLEEFRAALLAGTVAERHWKRTFAKSSKSCGRSIPDSTDRGGRAAGSWRRLDIHGAG